MVCVVPLRTRPLRARPPTPVAVPDAANVPATYAAVATKGSKNPVAAQAFLTWLAGGDAQAVLAKYGFLPAK